jgi:hypothetical protein
MYTFFLLKSIGINDFHKNSLNLYINGIFIFLILPLNVNCGDLNK